MHPFVYQQMIRFLSRTKTASKAERIVLKVAMRFIKQSSIRDFDILCRLQILEGAVGIRNNLWSHHGLQGLQKAKTDERLALVDPIWFSRENTGFYNKLLLLSKSLLRENGEDVLQSYLMGLSKHFDLNKDRPLWVVGHKNTEAILSGDMSPEKSLPVALSFLKKKLYTDAKAKAPVSLTQTDEDGDESQRDIATTSEVDGGDVFVHLLMSQTPLGIEIRKQWKDAILATSSMRSGPKSLMAYWVDLIDETGTLVTMLDLARKVQGDARFPEYQTGADKIVTNMSGRFFPKAIEILLSILQRDSALKSKINSIIISAGGDPDDIEDLDWDALKVKAGRHQGRPR